MTLFKKHSPKQRKQEISNERTRSLLPPNVLPGIAKEPPKTSRPVQSVPTKQTANMSHNRFRTLSTQNHSTMTGFLPFQGLRCDRVQLSRLPLMRLEPIRPRVVRKGKGDVAFPYDIPPLRLHLHHRFDERKRQLKF